MRILAAVFFMLTMTTASYAKDVFTDKELKDVQVTEIKDGKAVVISAGNAKHQVGIGDHIGKGAGKVVEINKAFIVIETESARTRMPLTHGFRGN